MRVLHASSTLAAFALVSAFSAGCATTQPAAPSASAVPAVSAAPGPASAPGLDAAPVPASGGPRLVPDDAGAKAALETSPRHGEWADVALSGSDVTLRTWVVYPERKDRAPVVLVIHEIYGLSDWIRSVADALAAEGFLAVAPDLIAGLGPGGGGTESAASSDDVVKMVRALAGDETRRRLDAVRAWATKLPAARPMTATVGFCWGGSQSFSYATSTPPLGAAVVYYGSSPAAEELAKVTAPVLGLYGSDDARVNATVDPAKAELDRLGKSYEVETYDGAGHGFLKRQSAREGANKRAAEKAWPRTIAFLKAHLEGGRS